MGGPKTCTHEEKVIENSWVRRVFSALVLSPELLVNTYNSCKKSQGSVFQRMHVMLLTARRYDKSIDVVVVKLALLLELGVLLGPSLPFIIPLLLAGAWAERCLAAVAWDKRILEPVFKLGAWWRHPIHVV